MKKNLRYLVIALLLPLGSQAQSTLEKSIEIEIQEESPIIGYAFHSNRYITEDKVPMLQERLKFTFPDLISISIDFENQKVDLKLPRAQNKETLTRILNYFNTGSYETL